MVKFLDFLMARQGKARQDWEAGAGAFRPLRHLFFKNGCVTHGKLKGGMSLRHVSQAYFPTVGFLTPTQRTNKHH
jgi:hypothetical protein